MIVLIGDFTNPVQVFRASDTAPVHRWQGGPADGMIMGETVGHEGDLQLIAGGPSESNSSPPPAALRPAVNSVINAYRMQDPKLDAGAVAKASESVFCPDLTFKCASSKPFVLVPLAAGYSANTPYYLADGRVRIEWMEAGSAKFISLISFDGALISKVQTHPAVFPMKITKSGADSNG